MAYGVCRSILVMKETYFIRSYCQIMLVFIEVVEDK
jgi:hypothetical protein